MDGQTSIQYRGKVYGWSNFYSVPREGLWMVKIENFCLEKNCFEYLNSRIKTKQSINYFEDFRIKNVDLKRIFKSLNCN